ncbi:DUF1330 domain-containing protein [Parasphingorhabdus sp.]|uniref:DUF1330 domain-containing protein n=1 Tax=Parasphingorhabdus sp. TaxID=2709688 RepID=UPI003592EE5C
MSDAKHPPEGSEAHNLSSYQVISSGKPLREMEGRYQDDVAILQATISGRSVLAISTTGLLVCWTTEPVPERLQTIMLISGKVFNWKKYQHYLAGLIETDLIATHKGVPLLFGPHYDILKGEYPDDQVSIAIGFPAEADAVGFWTSDTYLKIRKRREGAADLNVALWSHSNDRVLPRVESKKS